jgi:hypothetical protein
LAPAGTRRRRRGPRLGVEAGWKEGEGVEDDVGGRVEEADAQASAVDEIGEVDAIRHVLDGQPPERFLVVVEEEVGEGLVRGGRDRVTGVAVLGEAGYDAPRGIVGLEGRRRRHWYQIGHDFCCCRERSMMKSVLSWSRWGII